MDLNQVRELGERLKAQVARVVMGQAEVVDLVLVALLSRGHVLLEGVPGTAKTLLAQSISQSLALKFNRIQFTPDLMPGDVTGTNLFNFQSNQFNLTKGPIFTEMLLADEINRTPPKTQAALLQAMQERSVTIDGKTHELGPGFLVIATQNPIEHEGTYPLPEAQLDRFLFKIDVGYPDRAHEVDMVRIHGHQTAMPRVEELGLESIANLAVLEAARTLIANIRLSDPLLEYVVDLVRATRSHPSILCGASPRAANMLATAARATAALSGRDYVIPDDVKALAAPALGHRLVLGPAAEIEGITAGGALKNIIKSVPAPR